MSLSEQNGIALNVVLVQIEPKELAPVQPPRTSTPKGDPVAAPGPGCRRPAPNSAPRRAPAPARPGPAPGGRRRAAGVLQDGRCASGAARAGKPGYGGGSIWPLNGRWTTFLNWFRLPIHTTGWVRSMGGWGAIFTESPFFTAVPVREQTAPQRNYFFSPQTAPAAADRPATPPLLLATDTPRVAELPEAEIVLTTDFEPTSPSA